MGKVRVSDVKVKEERFRGDYGDISGLAVSIQKYGLFHPIIVDEELNLIAGERRLKAHMALGLEEIEVRKVAEADLLVKREIEIEENLRRKDFTWQEEVKAKAEVDKIKRELYGAAIKGHGGGWGLKDTAESLGESVGLTSRDIRIAEAMAEDPIVAAAKTKEEAWRLMQRRRERDISASLAEKVVVRSDRSCLVKGDSATSMSVLPSESVDVVVTDPPYGISLLMKAKDGNVSPYQDDVSHILDTIDKVVGECYRVLKEGSHMYLFYDPRNYGAVREVCERKGFSVTETPLVWHKTGGGGPGGGPLQWARNYESILFCYKGKGRTLNKLGESDVLVVPRIPPQKKIHPTEKPRQLLRQLIEQSTEPGDLVVDPFAGSGSTLLAAFECKRQAWGCELDEEYWVKAVGRIEEWGKEKEEE